MRLELAPGDVHAWWLPTDAVPDDALDAALPLLNDEERARHARFVFARDRRLFLVAHAWLRRVLSGYDLRPPEAWQFETGAFGKPALAAGSDAPRLSFNLSHTHGCVACVVARDRAVGIDVEAVDRLSATEDVARRFFAPSEVAQLESASAVDRQQRFFEFWTLKEAYIKARGAGLSLGLDTFAFDLSGGPARIGFSPPPGDEGPWHFALATPEARFRLATAVAAAPGDPVHVRIRRAWWSCSASQP